MKKITILSLLMLCALGANAQANIQFVPYTPVYGPQQNQRQSQPQYQPQYQQPQYQQPRRTRDVSNITAYRYVNSGWQKVTLQLTIDGNHVYISGYRDKSTGHMYDGITCPVSEVSTYDGETIYNNFDYKANVSSLGMCYF